MPKCPRCGANLSSGEECRFFEAYGWCWSCWPHGLDKLLRLVMGEDVEGEKNT